MAQQITSLTADADQLMTFGLPDGTDLRLEFVYRPAIQRWSLNLTHDQLSLVGLNLCIAPNLLRQWRNLISFGIAITAVDNLDPVDPSDFVTGRIALYILTAEEVQQVEDELLQPIPLVNP